MVIHTSYPTPNSGVVGTGQPLSGTTGAKIMARGSINKSPGHGKKIATFPFDVEQEADGKIITRKVMIDAYMQSAYKPSSEPPKMVIATQFYLRCEGEQEWGTDLNACLSAMRGKLDRKYRIQWKPWLLVRVTPGHAHKGSGTGLTLSWERIEKGTALDGSHLMREYDTYGDFNNRWRISPWPAAYKDKSGKTVACVLETEENIRALETFAEKLRDLTRTLAAFVAPDRIDDTLKMIAAGDLRLLTSGS